MSTMIAGSVMPGGGRCVYQLMPSAISAACAATIAMRRRAPAPHRGVVGDIMQSKRVHGGSASAVEADQRDLEIAGVAQQVHHLHQVAIADRLVGAQVDPLVLAALGGAIERARSARRAR